MNFQIKYDQKLLTKLINSLACGNMLYTAPVNNAKCKNTECKTLEWEDPECQDPECQDPECQGPEW